METTRVYLIAGLKCKFSQTVICIGAHRDNYQIAFGLESTLSTSITLSFHWNSSSNRLKGRRLISSEHRNMESSNILLHVQLLDQMTRCCRWLTGWSDGNWTVAGCLFGVSRSLVGSAGIPWVCRVEAGDVTEPWLVGWSVLTVAWLEAWVCLECAG